MPTPRRVLMVVENLPVPTDRRVWHEARSLTRHGWSVTVVCPKGPGASAEVEVLDGVAIHRFEPWTASGGIAAYAVEYGWAMLQIWRASRRLSREASFDVAHVSNPPDLLLFPLVPLRRRGTRFIFDHHDLVPELFASRYGRTRGVVSTLTRYAERLTFRLADVVISTNESYRAVATDRGRKPADRVFVVRNAPDPERFEPSAPDPDLKHGRPFLVAYAGRMGPQDGVDHGLRALAALRRTRGDWHAVFGGDGDVRPEMRRLSHELGLAEHVEFPGWLDNDALITLLSTADVCLAPEPSSPLNDKSTLVKIAEYMAMAKPVVCFDLTESRVTAGEAAAYASPNDTDALARLISTLLDDPAKRAEMGTIGRERATTTLAWEHSERALIEAYDRVVQTDA